MFKLFALLALLVVIESGVGQPIAAINVDETDHPAIATGKNNLKLSSSSSSLSSANKNELQKIDHNGERYARHIGGVGGAFGGVGVIGGGGFAAPVYAPPVAVVSAVPVVTTVPVVSAVPSYPVYGGYGGGYGGGFGGYGGGFGAGFGVAKFKVKGFGIGGGFLG